MKGWNYSKNTFFFYGIKMNDAGIKNLAKRIQQVKTFQELHDIIMAYAKTHADHADRPSWLIDPPEQQTGGKQAHEEYNEPTGIFDDGLPF